MTDLEVAAVATDPAAAATLASAAAVVTAVLSTEAMMGVVAAAAASTAAVTTAAATATAVLSQVSTAASEKTEHQEDWNMTTTTLTIPPQPLENILLQYAIPVYKNPTIEQMQEGVLGLDRLLYHIEHECSNLHAGRAPGFETNTCLTTDLLTGRVWSPYYPYETLRHLAPSPQQQQAATTAQVPLPSPASTLNCYRGIRQAWIERIAFVSTRGTSSNTNAHFVTSNDCSCIATWEHCKSRTIIQIDLANQVLEQNMVQESSHQVTAKMLYEQFHKTTTSSVTATEGATLPCTLSVWDEMYTNPETCPSPYETSYVSQVPIRFLRDRDDYISIYCRLAFACRSSIKVCTSYLFVDDPAQRYILLDLLPHMAMTKDVQVEILVDLMTVESAIMKSVFLPTAQSPSNTPDTNTVAKSQEHDPETITTTSFLKNLLPGSPPFDKGKDEPKSALNFLQKLVGTAATIPQDKFKVRWWCARDGEKKYRIKNHAKCTIFDEQAAFIGGSNLVPTVKSATSDCDLLVQGRKTVQHINNTFLFLWNGMDEENMLAGMSPYQLTEEEKKSDDLATGTTKSHICDKVDVANPNNEKELNECLLTNTVPGDDWDDPNCRVSFVRSTPTSDGEDAILRSVIGAINTSQVSITMCMGHCNIPASFTQALSKACDRGVHVRIMINSLYSNDLRGGQRDLFVSLHHLMTVAPKVRVYATDLLRHKPCLDQQQPAFLHSKYIVIDHEWSAVGSWNLWTRASFYEIEHELLVYSTKVASYLEGKFERESNEMAILLHSADQCLPGNGFCPKGCHMCEGYGPFFVAPSLPSSSVSLIEE
eukprot:CAMPEP_0195281000 /NCGR_PEP_ID=MMETSP0707-20130614/480_1 /TAXON_ID=33640 /ORGANISM="Asterionellopsis glacialis, Strain CCMP134" /LENGTH=820 /DNA_ID=CAMNT_0040339835 /DNA_START=229 /DNA_END=2691 /DNA_ORIENTATION=-